MKYAIIWLSLTMVGSGRVVLPAWEISGNYYQPKKKEGETTMKKTARIAYAVLTVAAVVAFGVLIGDTNTTTNAAATAPETTSMNPAEHYWVKGLVTGVVMTPDGKPAGEMQEWKDYTTARINDSLVMEKPACYGLYLQPTRIDGSKVFFEKFGKEWCINRSDLTQDPRRTFQWKDICSALDGQLLGFNAEHA